jgi:CheY-like chemotaxis protein
MRARTPVWAVTTHVLPCDVAQCMDAGMDGLLSKPVDLGLLREVLDGVVGTSRLKAACPGLRK